MTPDPTIAALGTIIRELRATYDKALADMRAELALVGGQLIRATSEAGELRERIKEAATNIAPAIAVIDAKVNRTELLAAIEAIRGDTLSAIAAARAAQPPRGEKGDAGERGAQGESGASGAQGERGAQGEPGLLDEVTPWSAEKYARGRVVTHRSGLWQSKCTTTDEPGPSTDWRSIAAGVSDIHVVQNALMPRKAIITIRMSDGALFEIEAALPIPLHVGRWTEERAYTLNDETAWGGCTWRAQRATKGTEPGKHEDWLLVSKQGKRGDAGLPGPQGERGVGGAMGPRGEPGERGDRGAKGDTPTIGPMVTSFAIGTEYPKGVLVIHAGCLWRALVNTRAVPDGTSRDWELVLVGKPTKPGAAP